MNLEILLPSTRDAAARRRTRELLAAALAPGGRKLTAAGVLRALATAATAAAYFGVAAVAQNALLRHVGVGRDVVWLGLIGTCAVLRAACGSAASRLAMDGALDVERLLRTDLLRRLLDGSVSGSPSAEQATAVMDEVESVGCYAERYQPARVAAILVPVIVLAAAFSQNWVVGALLVLCAPLPPLNLSIIGMGTAEVARRHAEELRHLSGYFLDRLRGMATLRALGAEHSELDRVKAASERLAATSMAVLRVAFVSAAALEGIVTIAVAVIAIYIGLTLLGYVDVPGLPAHMTLRTGLFLLMVTPLYFQPVRTLAAAYHERARAAAAIDALAPLLTAPADDGQSATRTALTTAPEVTFENVSVVYDGRDAAAVSDLSLRVDPGDLVGVSGPSGAGKSTLLALIAGDLEPTAGRVTVAGRSPREIDRATVGWLGQRPYLFSGSLAENIALGDDEVGLARVARAAGQAGLEDVIDRAPHGLATSVGEHGWGFSGGEAHRIALARTFYRSSPLLLLDEPTAHLDSTTEATIIDVIASLARSGTTILATHSPALLAICDRVLVLDRGQLVQGSRLPAAQEIAA
jgi:ATP-binding cassette, subfamily C, bacterial CydD